MTIDRGDVSKLLHSHAHGLIDVGASTVRRTILYDTVRSDREPSLGRKMPAFCKYIGRIGRPNPSHEDRPPRANWLTGGDEALFDFANTHARLIRPFRTPGQ